MKILLDECVPWPLHKLLKDCACESVPQKGWNGMKNGELLNLAEGHYDLFLTADQNIPYQQNLAGRRISVLQLSTNNLRRLIRAEQEIQAAIANMQPGKFHSLAIP